MKKKSIFLGIIIFIVTLCAGTVCTFARTYGGQVLYEIKPEFFMGLVLSVVIALAIYTTARVWLKDNKRSLVSGIIAFLVVFLLLAFPGMKVYLSYKTGNFIEASGAVKDFETSDKKESFTLDGVVFKGYAGSSVGYDLTKSKGGVITDDGQMIYVRYVKLFGRNVICYIEDMM